MAITPDTTGNTPITTGATSASVDITAAAVGSWVYLWCAISTATTTQAGVPSNASWTTVQSTQTAAGTSGACYALYRRLKQAGDTTFSFSWTASAKGIFAWQSYNGLDPVTPDENSSIVQNDTTSRTAVPSPTATPSAADRWALACFGVRTTTTANKPISWTPDAATTERADVDNNAAASSAWMGCEIADSNAAVAQSPQSYTATHNAAESHDGSLIAFLVPAVTASGVLPVQPGETWLRQFRHRQIPWLAGTPGQVYTATAGAYSGSPVALTTSTLAGNAIAVWYDGNGTSFTCSDSQGNTYVRIGTVRNGNCLFVSTYNRQVGVPTVPLVAGTDTISLTGATGGAVVVQGVTGIAPIAADAAPAATGATSSSASGPATGILSQAGDIVLAGYLSGTGWTATWGGGFSPTYATTSLNGTGLALAYQAAPSTASVTPSATLSSSVNWSGLAVALAPLGTAIPGPAAVYPLRGPVEAPRPQFAPLKGRTAANPGVYSQTGPALTPLRAPVATGSRGLPPRGRGASSRGTYGQLGPPLTPLRGPVVARALPLRGGRVRWNAGTFTAVTPNTGPPVYPLHGPVRRRPQPPPRGRCASSAGTRQQTGPPVTPLQRPVRARPPLPPKGRCAGSAGTFTAVVLASGAPLYPLHGPVRTRPQPPPRGRCAGSRGVYSQAGPPAAPLHRPVAAFRPSPYRPGRCAHNPGAYGQGGPAFYPLRRPARARIPQRPRGGRTAGNTGAPVFVPPFTIGTLTAQTAPGATLTASGATTAVLTAAAASGTLTATTAAGGVGTYSATYPPTYQTAGVLTATDQPAGGPG